MKWREADSRIIFNVIIALIVGIIFGNFLGGSMLKNESIYVNANNYTDDVYLLQTGVYYDEDVATNALNDMKQLGLIGIVVKENNNYYVYHGIAGSSDGFNEETKILEDNGINYLIKTKKLYYMLTDHDPTTPEYAFYYDSITYFISLVNDSNVVLSDDYIDSVDVVNLDLYNSINILNNDIDSHLTPMYKLNVYKDLVDLLL